MCLDNNIRTAFIILGSSLHWLLYKRRMYCIHILNSSAWKLHHSAVAGNYCKQKELYSQYKLSTDVYGNNFSFLGWGWHLILHVRTCFYVSFTKLRLWNTADCGVNLQVAEGQRTVSLPQKAASTCQQWCGHASINLFGGPDMVLHVVLSICPRGQLFYYSMKHAFLLSLLACEAISWIFKRRKVH